MTERVSERERENRSRGAAEAEGEAGSPLSREPEADLIPGPGDET